MAKKKKPVRGLYEACDPTKDEGECHNRLKSMRNLGSKAVLNTWLQQATPEQKQRYADKAHKLGMKVIWPLENPILRNKANPEAEQTAERFKRHPATWGYSVADEPNKAQRGDVKNLSKRLKKVDPDHPTLANHFKNPKELRGAADVVGSNFYPVGTRHKLEEMKKVAQRNRKAGGRAMILQSFNWRDTNATAGDTSRIAPKPRFPSSKEMTRMAQLSRKHARPELELWYDYNSSVHPTGGKMDRVRGKRLAKVLKSG